MLYQLGPWSLVGLNVLGRFWVKDHTATPGPPGWELDRLAEKCRGVMHITEREDARYVDS